MARSVDKDKHAGLQHYGGPESGNIFNAQLGSDILKGAATTLGIEYIANEEGTDTSTRKFYPDVRYWVTLKALDVDSSLSAKTRFGQDFLLDVGTDYDTATDAGISSRNFDLKAEDTVNGIFTKVRICDVVTYVQAYRG